MAGVTIWRVPEASKDREDIGFRLEDGRIGSVRRSGQHVRLVVEHGQDMSWEYATLEQARKGFNEAVARALESYAPDQTWNHTQAMAITGLSRPGLNKAAHQSRRRLGSRPVYGEGYRYSTEELARVLRRDVRVSKPVTTLVDVRPEQMRKALEDRGGDLSLTQRRVIELRYGTDGKGLRSLQETANELKISRQGVAWAERKAVAHLLPNSLE